MEDELQIPPNHVVILSVQPASDTVIEPTRRRRETQSDLDVLLAVEKTQDTFRRGNPLRRQLTSVIDVMEKKMNVQVDKVRRKNKITVDAYDNVMVTTNPQLLFIRYYNNVYDYNFAQRDLILLFRFSTTSARRICVTRVSARRKSSSIRIRCFRF